MERWALEDFIKEEEKLI